MDPQATEPDTQGEIDANQELNTKNRLLEEINAKNETILESIGDGVIVVNTNGEITYINKQVEVMTGWKEVEMIGKHVTSAMHLSDEKGAEVPPDKNPVRNALFENKKIVSNEYYYIRKDGSTFAAAIIATPILLGKTVIGGVNTFRDVTHERDIDRMKTEFISLASHQLRTPLSAMKWFSEMLLDGDAGVLSDEQKKILENIYQSNERMIELVNTLLNISRIESGRIIIDPKPTDLKKLIEEVVVELTQKIQEKKHKLVVSVHGDLPLIPVDPKLVRHVYMNLLTNAIKYTPPNGEIVVLISKSADEVISQVSDNGYGIPQAEQQKTFTKFFRAKNIVSVETDGTGLGLYLTKAIVESSGGKIWFESHTKEENVPSDKHGTTFWFVLPLSGSVAKEGEVTIDS